MPKTFIVGNWKMNQNLEEIQRFFKTLDPAIQGPEVQKWIAPQFVHIPLAFDLASSFQIMVGAQNCASSESGAYTGEVSAASLKELDVHFVILGHSERRSLYKEVDGEILAKAKTALKNDLAVIICVGETLEERDSGKTMEVVLSQLKNSLGDISLDPEKVLIAYEPVWAIGTGKTASPEEANEVHMEIRKFLVQKDAVQGEKTAILYGGSVKPSNIKDLLGKSDINGALVGGASLKADDYSQLCTLAI